MSPAERGNARQGARSAGVVTTPVVRDIKVLDTPEKSNPATLMANSYTALIHKEDDGYVALCPELDVASQGTTVEEARANLQEAITLLLEHAPEEEMQRREKREMFVTSVTA